MFQSDELINFYMFISEGQAVQTMARDVVDSCVAEKDAGFDIKG